MSYVEAMNAVKPLGELLLSHSHRDLIQQGIASLLELGRTGEMMDSKSFGAHLNEGMNKFASYYSHQCGGVAVSKNEGAEICPTADDGCLGDLTRRNGGSNSGRPRQKRLKPSVEGSNKTRKTPMCSFCQMPGHKKGQRCPSYSTWKQFECTDDEVTQLKSMLGSTTLHKFLPCPPAIESILKAREEAQETVPWPFNGAHMILVGAYFDCDVPSVATRYGSDPRIDNVLNNIIAVSFLKLGGCELFEDFGGKKTFYLRVHEAQKLIVTRCSGKRRLLNKLPKK